MKQELTKFFGKMWKLWKIKLLGSTMRVNSTVQKIFWILMFQINGSGIQKSVENQVPFLKTGKNLRQQLNDKYDYNFHDAEYSDYQSNCRLSVKIS